MCPLLMQYSLTALIIAEPILILFSFISTQNM